MNLHPARLQYVFASFISKVLGFQISKLRLHVRWINYFNHTIMTLSNRIAESEDFATHSVSHGKYNENLVIRSVFLFIFRSKTWAFLQACFRAGDSRTVRTAWTRSWLSRDFHRAHRLRFRVTGRLACHVTPAMSPSRGTASLQCGCSAVCLDGRNCPRAGRHSRLFAPATGRSPREFVSWALSSSSELGVQGATIENFLQGLFAGLPDSVAVLEDTMVLGSLAGPYFHGVAFQHAGAQVPREGVRKTGHREIHLAPFRWRAWRLAAVHPSLFHLAGSLIGMPGPEVGCASMQRARQARGLHHYREPHLRVRDGSPMEVDVERSLA